MGKFIIFVFALFAFGATHAVTRCVKLDASKSCRGVMADTYQTNWEVNCDGVQVSGVSHCSNQNANYKDKSNRVSLSENPEENIYCWCKLTNPAVSSWVFYNNYKSASNCAKGCGGGCAHGVTNHETASALRSALFSDLGI